MRQMSLTPELVALCHREEIDPGPSGEWTQLGDDDFGALATRLAGEADEGPLWVFAYGSLIWKPAFESVEQQRASAHGWHRSFCLDLVRWRGSAAQPGLMMALERGGRCDGVIYRLPEGESWPRSRDCSHLETFGIHDRNLWRLQQLVADEIRSIHSHRIANRDAAENIEAVII